MTHSQGKSSFHIDLSLGFVNTFISFLVVMCVMQEADDT